MSEQNKSSTNKSEGSSSSTQNESRDIATVKEGSDTSAFIIKEIQPVVRGVLVVAEGRGHRRPGEAVRGGADLFGD